jgi:hypothetical protein
VCCNQKGFKLVGRDGCVVCVEAVKVRVLKVPLEEYQWCRWRHKATSRSSSGLVTADCPGGGHFAPGVVCTPGSMHLEELPMWWRVGMLPQGVVCAPGPMQLPMMWWRVGTAVSVTNHYLAGDMTGS